jgi:bifunctional non-homologous end joining protein LigD
MPDNRPATPSSGARPTGEDPAEAQESLTEYRRKRDFGRTPEPSDEAGGGGDGDGERRRFVVQQHDATRLHWDLRLEADGVLRSWALPRGIPWDPKRNNLAVHTEDHPLQYLTFEGDIPEGEYGAGRMFVWDTGTYELVSEKPGKLVVELHGEQAQGRYALFRTGAERDWMIHRMDPPADPARRWPPDPPPAPMQATPGEAVDGDEWAWEVRLSGLRVMVTLLPGAVLVHDAGGNDLSDRFVDVRRMGRATGSREAVLDGVIEAEADHLERRLKAAPSSRRRVAEATAVRFVAFDVVWWEGHPCHELPWDERRARLDALELDGPAWSSSPVHLGDGPVLAEAAARQDVAGVVGKRRTSPYRAGQTSDDWIDVSLD